MRPRFLADEDLRREIVLATRRQEPQLEFVSVVELGLGSADDADLLEFASSHRWLMVSHDVNTMKAAAETRLAAGDAMTGLFLAPQARPTRVVAESLVLIWFASEFEEWQGRVVYLPL